MVKKADWIWFDGELVPWDECNVHILTHTLHYGLGVFEGIRAYQRADGRSAIFRLREHIERFVKGAHMITLPMSYDVDQLVDACAQTVIANKQRGCYLRPIAFVILLATIGVLALPALLRKMERKGKSRADAGLESN